MKECGVPLPLVEVSPAKPVVPPSKSVAPLVHMLTPGANWAASSASTRIVTWGLAPSWMFHQSPACAHADPFREGLPAIVAPPPVSVAVALSPGFTRVVPPVQPFGMMAPAADALELRLRIKQQSPKAPMARVIRAVLGAECLRQIWAELIPDT